MSTPENTHPPSGGDKHDVEHLARFLRVAEEAAQAAAAIALGGFRGPMEVRAKGHNDLVTEYDTAAEREAISVIRRYYPDHDILGEEFGTDSATDVEAEYFWAVDPIDGTHNYAFQLPLWCTSVAVIRAATNEVVAGAVYDAVHDELFTAQRGGGTKLNGVPAGVSDVTKLEDAFIATDIGYGDGVAQHMTALLPWVQRNTRRYRLLGSAILAMVYVAVGRFDGYYHLNLQPWDISAASLIITEAGGAITDWDGNPLARLGRTRTSAVAGTAALQPEILRLLHEGDAQLQQR